MAFPEFSMRQLLEAGVHFGHHARRWNPKMREYIFGVRNGVHIIDLQMTVPMLHTALKTARDIAANGGRILFVGTKRQAQAKIAEAAKRCGQYYVNQRWLGGMLTNWKTISNSINRLREVEDILSSEKINGYTKKEQLMMAREREKLMSSIGGIKDMGGQPGALFVVDITKDDIAVKEANKLGIPVIAVIDSNANPDGVTFPIPGNDDALRAIELYCDLMADAILDGLQAELGRSGVDLGAAVDVKVELPQVVEETEVEHKMQATA
ncbi:MAG: 30S ribosomal protein S2 [Alphaproteobacteria bacterium]|nr:30S ribosomal protein S2 [Alphaproteobacteria bacterium]